MRRRPAAIDQQAAKEEADEWASSPIRDQSLVPSIRVDDSSLVYLCTFVSAAVSCSHRLEVHVRMN